MLGNQVASQLIGLSQPPGSPALGADPKVSQRGRSPTVRAGRRNSRGFSAGIHQNSSRPRLSAPSPPPRQVSKFENYSPVAMIPFSSCCQALTICSFFQTDVRTLSHTLVSYASTSVAYGNQDQRTHRLADGDERAQATSSSASRVHEGVRQSET